MMLLILIALLAVMVKQAMNQDILLDQQAGDRTRKVYVYYEGKYFAQGDGSPINTWQNWATNDPPDMNGYTFEMYPDTRDYNRLYPTNFPNLNNGNPARLFSSWDDSTIDLHFKWMREHLIDGVAFERNVRLAANPAYMSLANGMLDKIRRYAEQYDLKYYIVYDLEGWNNFATELPADIDYLIRRGAFESRSYAIQSGQAAIGVNGIGTLNGPGNVTTLENIIDRLQRFGFYVIGGVGAWFRYPSQGRPWSDSRDVYDFLPVYNRLNMIQPINMGRYHYADFFYHNKTIGDYRFLNRRNIGFLPVLSPGFTNVSRLNGDFYWLQFVKLRELGIMSGIVYKFDGFGDATAIAKAAEDISMLPSGTENRLRALNSNGVDISSDYYLRLTHEGIRMIRTEIPLRTSHGIPLSTATITHLNNGVRYIVQLTIMNSILLFII